MNNFKRTLKRNITSMNMIMIIIITHSQLAMGSRPAEYCNFNSKASAHAYHHMILDVISNEQNAIFTNNNSTMWYNIYMWMSRLWETRNNIGVALETKLIDSYSNIYKIQLLKILAIPFQLLSFIV